MTYQQGRPSTYRRDMADYILSELVKGRFLRSICRKEGMPCESTVRGWATADVDGFSARYSRAQMLGVDTLADEITEIGDNRAGSLKRDKLRIKARFWVISKLCREGSRWRPPEPDPLQAMLAEMQNPKR